MNTYEIEGKLRDKVDKWELYNIQSENRELKSQVRDLERRIDALESDKSHKYYIIDKLINLLAENILLSEISDELHELRGNL